MSFWQYVFSFLYVRNWHTGRRELSYKRVFWLGGVVFFLVLIISLAWWLQQPAVYTANPSESAVQANDRP